MKDYKTSLKYQDCIDDIESNEKFEANIILNKVLLTGNAAVVERFYKQDGFNSFKDRFDQLKLTNSFWYNVGSKNARVFFGIVKMINDAYVRLVTSGGFETSVKRDGEVEENVELTKRLEYILKTNSFKDAKWGLAESFQSGLGFATLKASFDTDIVDVPIIEVIQPEKSEVITKRGFKVGYIFKQRVKVLNQTYEVQEIYYKLNNQVLIEYKVFNVTQEVREEIISKLEDNVIKALGLDFLKGKTVDESLIKLNTIPILLKNNTAYNSWFPQSPYGEADTQGIDNLEDSLSELLSSMVDEIRKGKIKVLISETLVQTTIEGQALGFDDFKLDYEIIKGDEANGKSLIQVVQGEINSDKFLKGIATLIMYACNKANLHPITLGLTGVESIAASQESQVEREKTSLRSREMKLDSWRESLSKFFNSVLQMDDLMHDKEIGEYDVTIQFGQFSNPSRENVIDLLGKAVTSGLMSIKDAQHELYEDNKDDNAKTISYIQTLVEKGMPLTPQQAELYNSIDIKIE